MLQFYIKELIRTECLQDIQINGKDYIVVINKEQDHVERRRFTALHELGHLLFDKHFSSDLTLREKEKLCDAFASEMLLPSNVVRKIFSPDERISTSEVRPLIYAHPAGPGRPA